MTTSEAYNYTIEFLCENLNVSKSGFYQWKKNRGRRREQEQREYELVRKIEVMFPVKNGHEPLSSGSC